MSNQTTPARFAVVKGNGVTAERVARFLPSNYSVLDTSEGSVLVGGTDNAGWTLEGYVIPRLASGCMFATEAPECFTWTGDNK